MTAFFLYSCTASSPNDFADEGNAISKLIVAELKQIRSRDDLQDHAAPLQILFTRLVDVIIRAQEYKDAHPDALLESLGSQEQALSDQLRIELNRVLHMEGGREVIEKSQEDALNRLDAFEKASKVLPTAK